MTPKTRKALEMALDTLEYHTQQTRPISRTEKAIVALTEALAEPAPRKLSDADIVDAAERCDATDPDDSYWKEFARAIEAHFKIGVTP